MTMDSEVFVFDHGRYISEFVPAMLDWLKDGTLADWLADTIRARGLVDTSEPSLSQLGGIDLHRYCPHVGRDLSYVQAHTDTTNLEEATWETRTCSHHCSASGQCPFHSAADVRTPMDLNMAAEGAIADLCLGASWVVGHDLAADAYNALLDRRNIPADAPLRKFLRSLHMRGYVIGYLWGGGAGIHGWLDPGETVEFVSALGEMRLPEYPATLEAMAAFYQSGDSGDWEWEEISLSFVRTISTIAVGEGRGILWGNDLVTDH